ncbi:MAG TPA: 30S ribosomal protein S1 [Bacteroidales bacterium]|nr:30S ribosomal protein S1 [Bacteroidales bacterium]HPM92388.1 30S ribosomal protein S1 [Bacteroidales bacterium]
MFLMIEKDQEVNNQDEIQEPSEVNETPEAAEAEMMAEIPAEEPAAVETPEETAEIAEEPEAIPEEPAETPEEPASEPEAPEEFIPVEDEPVKEIFGEVPVVREAPKPNPDFDWNAIGKKQEKYSDDERNRLEKIYDKTLSSIAEHEVIEGTVVGKNNREIVVNIGYKSDGVIPVSEVRYLTNIKNGDKLDVYVESQEDLGGQLVLSHKKARILKSWERVNSAFENDEIITGYVKCRTKGGLIVDVFGIEAFLPGSQIDVKPIRDYDIFVDKTMEFKVVKINQEYKNVVVSHKALIEAELELQKTEIMSKLEKGQVLEGTVKNITSYGVFIDLGGVDGLIHITDLSWGRINHPEEIVELDQKIKVVILDFDDEKKRIALGLKQLMPHPWESLDENLKIGDKVKGKVVVIADYGAFIEIAAGVEGLIHVSEMSWSQHLRTAHDFLKVGDEVEAIILTLDREERKMSLGMKQLVPDPWENIVQKYPINSKHTATVRNFTNFGIFVELEEGVDGLIHISDLSWSKKIKHPAEFTKIGEQIEVIVLDVDTENRRLSLGHKQLEENPWDVFESVFTLGSVHQGTVVSANDKGFIVSLPYGVEGFVPTRHAAKADNSMAKVDDNLDFKVIEFSKENKKIILSHARVHQDEARAERDKEDGKVKREQRTTNKAVKKVQDNVEKTTLGDLEALVSLKTDMEKQEKLENKEKLEKLEKKAKAEKAAKAEKEATAEKPEKEEKKSKGKAKAEPKAEEAPEIKFDAEPEA